MNVYKCPHGCMCENGLRKKEIKKNANVAHTGSARLYSESGTKAYSAPIWAP